MIYLAYCGTLCEKVALQNVSVIGAGKMARQAALLVLLLALLAVSSAQPTTSPTAALGESCFCLGSLCRHLLADHLFGWLSVAGHHLRAAASRDRPRPACRRARYDAAFKSVIVLTTRTAVTLAYPLSSSFRSPPEVNRSKLLSAALVLRRFP